MNSKIIAGTIGAIVIAVVAASVMLMRNIDGVVKELIQQVGTEVAGTTVTVDSVAIKLMDGSGSLSGLTIVNPDGFSELPLLALDNVTLQIDPSSLTESVYLIDEINIDGLHVLAEHNESGLNLDVLMDNIDSSESAGDAEASEASDEDVLLAVDHFAFTNSTAVLKSKQLGEHDLSLPSIELRGLGTRDKGLTPEQLAMAAMGQLVGQVQDAVKDSIKDLAADAAKKAIIRKIGDKGKEGMEKLKSLFDR